MIHICYCCNDGAIRQLLLSVLSVVKHCKKPLALHIATMDLTDVDERWQPFSKKSEEVVSALNKDGITYVA